MKRRKSKKTDFKPNRTFIQKAVRDCLKKGGKITKLEITSSDIPVPYDFKDVDLYLLNL